MSSSLIKDLQSKDMYWGKVKIPAFDDQHKSFSSKRKQKPQQSDYFGCHLSS